MKFDDILMKCVRKDLEKNLIPMLLGEPGIGKSSWLIDLARQMHTKCFVLACNQLADKADLTGARLVPILNKDGEVTDYKQMFYPHAVIHDAIEYAGKHPRETPILFMDELNRTTPDITSEALSIPTLREIGSKKLPDNLRVVIAGNDKGNVTALDDASISRFVLYRVEPDTQTFLGLDPELNPFVRKVLTEHPECIFAKGEHIITIDNDDEDMFIEDILDEGEDMRQITTPRTISGVSEWLNAFTNEELLTLLSHTRVIDELEISTLQEALEGHIGRTNFTKYLLAEISNGIMTTNNQAHTLTVGKPAIYDEMKECEDVETLHEFVEKLTDNDRSGALVYALYEKQSNQVYIQVLAKYIQRLIPSDMQVIMVLSGSDKLDSENVSTLLNTHTDISNQLSVILEY